MRLASLSIAATVLALSSTAGAQFSVATSSNNWATPQGPQNSTSGYGYSDCTSENALGLTNGGELAWFQGYNTADRGLTGDTIVTVNTAQGWSGGTNGAPGGSVGEMLCYDDPGGDNTDPNDLGCPGASAAWTTAGCCVDNKETVALPPVAVSDGFWQGAYLPHAPGEFPAAFDTDTAPSNGHTWVSGSNTVFDPCNPGGGIGFFDMVALGFDSNWLMSADGTGGAVEKYCTAKSGLVCGLPAIDSSGTPQAGAPNGFTVFASPARGNRSGLVLYSCNGRASFPFQGGLLCVNPAPLRRMPPVSSGGTNGACDGVFATDVNAFGSGNGGGNPDPCLSVSGQQVNTQFWGRDSVATGSFLSNALEFNM